MAPRVLIPLPTPWFPLRTIPVLAPTDTQDTIAKPMLMSVRLLLVKMVQLAVKHPIRFRVSA